MITRRRKIENQYDDAIEKHMITHPKLKAVQERLFQNSKEQTLIKKVLYTLNEEKNMKKEKFHQKRRKSAFVYGIKIKHINHEEKHLKHIQESRAKDQHLDHYIEDSRNEFKKVTNVNEEIVLVCHCPNIWALEGMSFYF
jgi:hypothetical protein